MKKQSTLSLTLIALGAALIAVLAQISLSIGPVPFTLQTLAVALVASLYRPKEAIISVLLYILLGGIGLPVFAGFSGGFSVLFGPLSGFIWGFVLFAAVTSVLVKEETHPALVLVFNVVGDAFCFVLGAIVFHFITKSSWTDTIAWTTLPFLVPDLIKLLLASIAHKFLSPVLKQIRAGR